MEQEISEDLRDRLDSFATFGEAKAALVDDRRWRALCVLYEEAGDEWELENVDRGELLDLLVEIADETEDKSERSKIYRAAGELAADLDGASNRAKKLFRESFRADTSNVGTLERARELYREDGDHSTIRKLYELEYKVTDSTERRADLLTLYAQALGEYEERFEEAIDKLDEALEFADEHPYAHRTKNIYLNEQTLSDELVARAERADTMYQQGEGDSAASIWTEVAALEAFREGGSRNRARAWLERAASIRVDDRLREVVDAFDIDDIDLDEAPAEPKDTESDDDSHAADTVPEEPPVIEQLTDVDASQTESDSAPETAEAPAELPPEGDDELEKPKTLGEESSLLEGRSIYERIEPWSESIDEAMDALERQPDNLSAFAAVRDHLRETSEWERLVDVIERTLRYLRKEEGEAELMAELASIYWKKLGDIERAEYYFKRLKLLDAEHPEVFSFYEAYYERQEKWRKLFSLLSKRQRNLEDPSEVRRIARRRAEVAEVEIGSADKAIDVWKEHLRQWDDPDARFELRRLYKENEKWNSLVDFLKSEVERLEQQQQQEDESTVDERVDILEQMADLYEDQLELETMAIKTLREIIRLDPEHIPAFNRLRDKLIDARRWSDLLDVFVQRAEAAESDGRIDRAVELRGEAADVADQQLNDTDEAVEQLECAVELDSTRADIRERLADIYRSRHAFDSLYELRRRELEAKEGSGRLTLLRDMAELARSRLNDPARELECLEEIRSFDPEDLETLDRLEELHRDRQDWDALVDLLTDKAGAVRDLRKEADICVQVARLRIEELEDPTGAADALRAALSAEPDHLEALDRLTELYLEHGQLDALVELHADRGDFDRLVDLLVASAGDTDDEEERRTLYRRAADIARDELADPARVVECLEALLQVAERPPTVADELVDWYQQLGHLEDEIEMRRLILDAGGPDEANRTEHLTRLAELEARRDRPESALHWQAEALRLHPDDASLRRRASQYAHSAASLADYVDLLEEIAPEVAEPDRIEILEECAELLVDDLDEPERAVETYETLSELAPSRPEYAAELVELYRRLGRPSELATTLERWIELRRNEGASTEWLVDHLETLADIQQQQLDNSEGTRQTLERALQIDPENLELLRRLRRLDEQEENWSRVADLLRRELGLLDPSDPDRSEVAKRLAEICRDQLDEPRDAIRYFDDALDANPNDTRAVDALLELLDHEEVAGEAARVLEPAVRQSGRIDALARVLETRLSRLDDPFDRLDILDDLVELYDDDLDEPERAFDLAIEQFELDTDREFVWDRLTALASDLDRWSRLDEAFMPTTPLADDPDTSELGYQRLRRLARCRKEELDAPEAAVDAWEMILERDPMDEEAIDALDALYREVGAAEPLADILEKRAELAASDERRAELLLEAARIYENPLGDVERAIPRYEDAHAVDPHSRPAFEALERLYQQREQWVDLEELWESRLRRSDDPEERLRLSVSLVELQWRQLGDHDGAVRRAVRLVNDFPEARQVIEAVEQLQEGLAENDGALDLRVELAEALEPVYRREENHERLVDVLALELESVENDPYARLDLLDELTEVRLGHLGRRDQAFDSLSQAVRIEPDDPDRRERFVKLGRSLERLEEVVEVLEDGAERAEALAAAPIFRATGSLAEEIGQSDRAIRAYERSLDIDESNLDALRALENLHAQEGNTEALTDVLRAQLDYADPDDRSELLSRIATLEKEVLDRPDRARHALDQWLEIEPSNSQAIEQLESIHRAAEDWSELVDVLHRKVEVLEEPDVQLETLLEIGDLERQSLGRVEDAIETYNRALDLDPSPAATVEAIDALEELYEASERWRDLVDVLDRKLELADHIDEDARAVTLRLADVCLERLDDRRRAVELYAEVLSSQIPTPRAREALEELVQSPEVAPEAASALERFYRREDQWAELADLLGLRARQIDDPEQRAELEMDQGRVLENHVADLQGAARAYSRAWQAAPEKLQGVGGEARESLRQLAESEGAWETWVDAAHAVLDDLHEPEARIELHWTLGRVYLDQIEDEVEAEEQFRAILEIEPTEFEAYDELESLLVDQERWLDLVDLLESWDEAEQRDEDATASSSRLHRIAELYEDQLEDELSAAETWETLRQRDPSNRRARESLIRLYREQGRWEELATRLSDEIDRGSSDRQTIDYMEELADICTEHLLDPERAVDLYGTILDRRPGHDEAVDKLEKVYNQFESVRLRASRVLEDAYRRREAWESIVELLAERSEMQGVEDPAESLAEGRRVAREYLGDPDWTYALGLELHQRRPADASLLEDLAQETADLDRWPRLAEHLEQVIEHSESLDHEERSDLQVALADIRESRLEQLDEARSLLRDVLMETPDHAEAIDAMERLLWRQQDWTELTDFYRERIERTEQDEQTIQWLRQLGGVYELMEADLSRAVDTYLELLEVDPDDAQAEAAVEELYAEQGRWHDLADFYRSRAEQVEDDRRRLELHHRLARTLEGDLQDIEGAVDVYAGILEEAPDRTETIRSAEGLLRDLERRGDWEEQRRRLIDQLLACIDQDADWRRSLDLLEQRRRVVEDIDAKAQTYRDQAELMLEAGENEVEQIPAVERAACAYCLRFDEESWRFLKDTADRLESWHRVPTAALSMLADVRDAEDRAKLLITVGDIYRDRLQDRSSAVEAYRDALDQGAESLAVERLEGELEQMEAWDALADTLERRLGEAESPDSERELLHRLATLHDQQLEEPTAAVDYYERLVDRDPTQREHVEALESLYRRTGAYEALRDLCEQQIGLVEADAIRADWMSRLATVQHEFLEQPERALETYRSLRDVAPDAEDALSHMASLLRELERWDELIGVLEEQRAFTDDTADIDVEIAKVQSEHLGQPANALERLTEVLAKRPTHQPAREAMRSLTTHPEVGERAKSALIQHFKEHDDAESWRTFLEDRTEALGDPGERAEAYIELADYHRDFGQGPRRAFAELSKAVRQLPLQDKLRARFRETAERLDALDDLIEVFEEIADDIESDEESAVLHSELAELYADHRDQIGKAIRHAKTAREARPADSEILDLLDRLYQQSGNWNALADILETRLEIADRGELTDVRFRLAYLHENMFEEAETAFEYYREVLEDDPDHGGAIGALERMIESEALEPTSLREAIRRLEELYRTDANEAELVELLSTKAEYLDDPIDRAQTLAEIARLRESLGEEPERVFSTYAEAFRADPLDETLQESIKRLASEHDLYESGVELLEDVLPGIEDPIRHEQVSLTAGRWSLEALEAPERAAEHFQRVLDEEPDHEDALEGLASALRETGDDEELMPILEQRAELVHDPDDQRELLLELSRLRRDAGEVEEAIDAAQRALTVDEGAVDILRHLVGLLDGADRPAEFVDTLERLAERTEEEERAAELFVRASEASEHRLEDPDRALSFAQRALDRVPGYEPAIDKLESLYRSRGAWDDVDDILRRKLELARDSESADTEEILRLTVQLGELAGQKRERPQEAVEWFEEALEIDPQHHGAVRALQRLYANEGRTDDLMDVWECQLEMTDDETHRRRVYCDMAVTSVRDLGDPEQAAEYLEQASELGPESPEVLHARRIYFTEQGDWISALEVLDRELEQAADQQTWRDLMSRRVEILNDQLDRPAEALESLKEIAREIPGEEEAFERALALADDLDDVESVCELHQIRAQRTDSEDVKVESMLKVADLAESELNDLELAAGALMEAHDVKPRQTDITERLIDVLLEVGDAERAEPLIDELIEEYDRQGKSDALVSLQHRRGRLAEARGDHSEAVDIYKQVHDRNASYVPNLLSLSTLAIETERWELAREISEKLLLHQMSLETDEQKVQVYYNLGRVRVQGGDERRAKDMFNRALNIDPDHQPSNEALESLKS